MFPVDCETVANQTTPHCARPSLVAAGSIGAGVPIIDTGKGTLSGGFIDGNRLIAAVKYSTSNTTTDSGYIVAIDLTSGDRTIISGTYYDAANTRQTVGTGTDFGAVNEVQLGPDGWYATTSNGVWKVAPTTGARTQVISSTNTATQCTVGTTKVIPRKEVFAVGPDATIYQALSNNPAGTGVGLVKVKAGVCTIISLGGGPSGTAKGSGATFTSGYFRNMRFSGGKVWALEFQSKSLMTVDPATGARVRVSSSSTTTPVGTGDVDVGSGGFGFGSDGGTVYTTLYDGLNQQLILPTIDMGTGDRFSTDLVSGPANKGGETYPPIWMHPTKPWLLVGVDNAIVEVDIDSGASYTLSR